VLYTFEASTPVAIAQLVKQNLKRIGINVVVKPLPVAAYDVRVPREPYDIAFTSWTADYTDPYATINLLLDGAFAGESNWARFDSPRYNRLLREVALLRGSARFRAYGKLRGGAW
jgi:ABC-type transport system substrate-binding protein